MRKATICLCLLLAITSCSKDLSINGVEEGPSTNTTEFVKHTIKKGEHYSDKNGYVPIATPELKFIVRFDSSAIYQTSDAANQYDINKLYGFADNNSNHHQFSARIGWRWSDGALRLFGYVYNDGIVMSKELGQVEIGPSIPCNIRVSPTAYIFSVHNQTDSLPRTSTTPVAQGYTLFPYFGGDEPAPHEVNIWVREIK